MTESRKHDCKSVSVYLFLAFAFAFGLIGMLWSLDITSQNIDKYSFYGPEICFAAAIWALAAGSMIASRRWHQAYQMENEVRRRKQIGGNEDPLNKDKTPEDIKRHLVDRKMHSVRGLLARDIGPLTFDVASHSDLAEVSEYRGIIHWHRDVIEKLLSVLLALIFSVFLGRGIFYGFAFFKSCMNIPAAITHDIDLIGAIIGLALVLDGILLVAAMSDAPGIGRTIDSLIVVLTGVAISSFFPLKQAKNTLHDNLGGTSIIIIFAVALLFIVRWIIRHHTLAEWIGMQKGNEAATLQNDGAGNDCGGASGPRSANPESGKCD